MDAGQPPTVTVSSSLWETPFVAAVAVGAPSMRKSMRPESPQPLDGLRVLDFTRVLGGPLSTALLADLGAEVIKVEPPGGDDYRAIGPMRDGHSALFTVMNRNKRSIVLDLKTEAARRVVHELAAHCDVIVEHFRPGVADRLGIGADDFLAVNPRIVVVSVSGFGPNRPPRRSAGLRHHHPGDEWG